MSKKGVVLDACLVHDLACFWATTRRSGRDDPLIGPRKCRILSVPGFRDVGGAGAGDGDNARYRTAVNWIGFPSAFPLACDRHAKACFNSDIRPSSEIGLNRPKYDCSHLPDHSDSATPAELVVPAVGWGFAS